MSNIRLTKLVIKNEFQIPNGDYRKKWCICGKSLAIPAGTEFNNLQLANGEYSDKYIAYLCESDEVMGKKGGFEKGKGMHQIVTDFDGIKNYCL